jgi:hypothetical protein
MAPPGYVGYVTRFAIKTEFLAGYEVQKVGGEHHLEYWIPAAELDAFNDHLMGEIEVVGTFRECRVVPSRQHDGG